MRGILFFLTGFWITVSQMSCSKSVKISTSLNVANNSPNPLKVSLRQYAFSNHYDECYPEISETEISVEPGENKSLSVNSKCRGPDAERPSIDVGISQPNFKVFSGTVSFPEPAEFNSSNFTLIGLTDSREEIAITPSDVEFHNSNGPSGNSSSEKFILRENGGPEIKLLNATDVLIKFFATQNAANSPQLLGLVGTNESIELIRYSTAIPLIEIGFPKSAFTGRIPPGIRENTETVFYVAKEKMDEFEPQYKIRLGAWAARIIDMKCTAEACSINQK